jgi:hypothetical protein
MEIRSVGAALIYADGLTDMKVISAFRDYANAPKNYSFCSHGVFTCVFPVTQ